MELRATYDNGRLYLDDDVALKHSRLRVTLVVEDDEIQRTTQQNEDLQFCLQEYPILERLAAILGPYAKRRRSYSIGEDRRSLVDALVEKYGQ